MIIVDDKDRVLIKVNDKGDIIIGRYKNLDLESKKMIVDLFHELTGMDKKKIKQFMNFKENKALFCS